MPNTGEIEIYFPYDNTYIEAGVYDYTSTFKFKCASTHFAHSENLDDDEMPLTEAEVKEKAIEWYRQQLRNMDSDKSV